MIKKVYALTLILSAVLTFSTRGQNSAQATMLVQARVVSGASLEMVNQTNFSALNQNSFSEMGVFIIKGISKDSSIRISSSDKISFTNSNGHEVSMEVGSRHLDDGSHRSIHYSGKFNNEMLGSTYRGELKTTIEYL